MPLNQFAVRIPASPTFFMHPAFRFDNKYPNGAADIAGYWAEDRLLGGVALFDRSQDWHEEVEPNVYFQSCRRFTTFRAWQLLDEQQDKLLSFLLASDDDYDPDTRPIPIFPSRANKVRSDPQDTIWVHSIYRDIWERERPPKRKPRTRRPIYRHPDDYPERQ